MNEKIINIGSIISGHTFRGAISPKKYGDIQVLQTKNIEDGGKIRNDFVLTNIDNYRGNSLIQKGDVLVSNRGNFRAAVYQGDEKNIVAASSIYILRLNSKKIISEYLSIFFNSKIGQKILKLHSRGSYIRSLPKKLFSKIEIPVLNIEEQKMIIKIYNNYFVRKNLYIKQAKLHQNIAETAINNFITF